MDTILGRYKKLIVLAAILFAQIIALAVQVRRPSEDGETRLVRVWAIAAVTPFEKAVVHSQKWARDKWDGYLYLRNVRRENEQLHGEIERMKVEQSRLSEDAKMARRIQTLLAFKEQYIESTIAAQVIGTSGSEQSRVLYIDKGSDDGLKPDMAVITPTGIVGKIVQVSATSAQVLPINDQLSGVGAALKDSRLQGILKGAPNGITTLQYIMSDEPVKPGDTVITSGGDRIFPKGLEIGTVASVEPGKNLFLNIRVNPSARLDRLEEVLVINKLEYKLPDATDLGPIRASDILSEHLPGVPVTPGVDAAGNATAPATGAANPAQGNTPAGTTTGAPGTTVKAAAPGTAGAPGTTRPATPAGASTAKPAPLSPASPGASTGAPKSNVTTAAPAGSTAPKPVRKPAVNAPADTTTTPPETKPATKPEPAEVPPQ